jgi:hypothetical protein
MQDMWKQDNCSLPCDQKVLRKASRVADRWDSCQEEVMDYFDRLEDESLTSNVLRGKWIKAKEVYESRQGAAKSTNSRRSPHGHRTVTDPIAPRSADTVTGTYTSTKTTAKTTAIAVIELPEWVDREVWNAYLEMRKKKRAAPTDRALKGILTQLGIFRNKGHDPNAVLDTSIRSNWTDVYEPKTGAGNGKQKHGKTDGNFDSGHEALAILGAFESDRDGPGEVGRAETGRGKLLDSGDLR